MGNTMISQANRFGRRTTCTVAFAAAMATGLPVAAQNVAGCLGDGDASGDVTVDEIVTTVNNALSGCGLESVRIPVRAVVGEADFACGNLYEGIGISGESILPSDLRFYLHDIRLLNDRGEEVALQLTQDGLWQYRDVVLLDFENKTPPCNQGTVQTNGEIRGQLPPGSYRGVRFRLGVPFDLNHGDASVAPSPLSVSAMFWSWRAGYKFLRFDDGRDLARVHIGSTACVGPNPSQTTRCDRLNIGEVFLPDFQLERDSIVADLARLFADSDLSMNTPDTVPGCESSPRDSDCVAIFQNLGINFENGLPDPSRQQFFRVEMPAPE